MGINRSTLNGNPNMFFKRGVPWCLGSVHDVVNSTSTMDEIKLINKDYNLNAALYISKETIMMPAHSPIS